MNKSKIEWCDSTWNPITGCKHGCGYCYARNIAKRFEGVWDGDNNTKMYLTSDMPKEVTGSEFNGYGLKYCVGNDNIGKPKLINAPYPYGFHPTLHRHRLESGVQRWKKPRNIFVGSMCDMFGNWVPNEWIQAVFNACVVDPQHRYLFLTKNPDRYWQINSEDKDTKPLELYETTVPLQIYFGASVTNNEQFNKAHASAADWISIEPLLEELYTENFMDFCYYPEVPRWKWVVIGAETGNRKDKVIPQREWIEAIVEECEHWGIPVFMKDSLKEIWGKPLIREYPWKGVKNGC